MSVFFRGSADFLSIVGMPQLVHGHLFPALAFIRLPLPFFEARKAFEGVDIAGSSCLVPPYAYGES